MGGSRLPNVRRYFRLSYVRVSLFIFILVSLFLIKEFLASFFSLPKLLFFLMSEFIFFVLPSFVLSHIHKLSGKTLQYLNNSPRNNWTRNKKRQSAIAALMMKVTSFFAYPLCLPCNFIAKIVRFCLLFITNWVHTLSGKALKSLKAKQQNQIDEEIINTQVIDSHPNLKFYLNKIPFQPSGDYIDNILMDWIGNYDLLLTHRNYIQWLFPNRQHSSNKHASVLTNYEAQKMKTNPEIMKRVMSAFRMMLDFWGMELTENDQFIDSTKCHERWEVFNNNPYLGMYVTRILKLFVDLDLQHLNSAWLEYLLELIFVRGELDNLKPSFANFWATVLPDREAKLMLSQCRKH